jgi:hypothetical protein
VCSVAGRQGEPQIDAPARVVTTPGTYSVRPFRDRLADRCRLTAYRRDARSPTVTSFVSRPYDASGVWLRAAAIAVSLLAAVGWIGVRRRRTRPDGASPPPLLHPPKHVV